MRVVVYGAGAVGGVIGARLFQHGHEVVLVARGPHAAALREHGMRLVDPDGETTLPINTVDAPDGIAWRADDVVFMTMKTQDATRALDALAAVAPDTAVVCAQNGVQNERMALRRFARVYAMCVMLPASHLEPGVVAASSAPITGLLDLGRYPRGVDDTANAIAAVLQSATFESIVRPDIMRWKYTKLLMNLGNAVEALCGPEDADGAELSRRARSEGAAVLRAAGVDVATQEEDRERRGDRLQPKLARGGGSSWQSLRRGTGTIETNYLNGEIVLLGRMNNVATPVNAMLQRAANAAARAGKPPGSVRAAELLASLG